MNLHVAILAAGKGTRMKSARPKVLHRVAGLPLIEHVLATAAALKPQTTTIVDDPGGYGRIVRSGEQIARIVEEKDASSAEREIREINSGIYAFELAGLFDAVRSIATENAQREYYLTNLVAVYRKRGMNVETVTVQNADEIRGVNSQSEMAAL